MEKLYTLLAILLSTFLRSAFFLRSKTLLVASSVLSKHNAKPITFLIFLNGIDCEVILSTLRRLAFFVHSKYFIFVSSTNFGKDYRWKDYMFSMRGNRLKSETSKAHLSSLLIRLVSTNIIISHIDRLEKMAHVFFETSADSSQFKNTNSPNHYNLHD